MKTIKISALLAVLAMVWAGAAQAAESQFYVFPVKEMEGLSDKGDAAARPLIDKRATEFLVADAQKDIIGHFNAQVAAAYPGAAVHAKQVRDALKGPVKLVDDDNQNCGDASTVPLSQSYAVVVGVTRASLYEVAKDARVEVLIPVTLNMQIVKPDKAKIVYSTSNTAYSRFEFARNEVGTDAYKQTVGNEMSKNIKAQIDQLVADITKNFSPKAMPVKIVGKDGPFIVVDKGFEVGFKDGDSPSAFDAGGKESVFKVISADDGYSVLELLAGDAKTGADYMFTFETKADDSRKPRVMPVKQSGATGRVNGAVDVFTKSIGFKAPFQIAAVDENFTQTMNSIQARASCVPEDKRGFATRTKESREDYPQLLLHVRAGESETFVESGKGGVLTKDTFATVVQAQLTDLNGVVYASSIGQDKYVLEKTAGIGLNLENAKEVSYQNATNDLVANFLKNVKLSPTTFRIKSAQADKGMVVENLPVDNGYEVGGMVVRKLGVKVNNKEALVRLPVTTQGKITKTGGDAVVPFQIGDVSKPYYAPRSGDQFVTFALPKAGAKRVALCEGEYLGKNNTVTSNFARPMVSNVIFNSPAFQVTEMNETLAKDVSRLLDQGLFKPRKIEIPDASACLLPGYLIREEKAECSAGACKAVTGNAVIVKLMENGESKKDYSAARVSNLQGFDENQKNAFYSINAFEQFLSMGSDLAKSLNNSK